MNVITVEVDMMEGVEKIRNERIPDAEERMEKIVDAARDARDEDDVEAYEQLKRSHDEVESKIEQMEGTAKALEHYSEEYGGSAFTVAELTGGQLRQVRDKLDRAKGGDGAREVKMLEESLVKGPPKAPTVSCEPSQDPWDRNARPDPGSYANRVFDWLYMKANAINTVGEASLGNSSLEDKL